jgi:hypothetical protein
MGVLSVGAVALSAQVTSATEIPCVGTALAGAVNGNVVAGLGCELAGAMVSGSVVVEPGGSLRVFGGTEIKGDLRSRKARNLQIFENTVIGGDLRAGNTFDDGPDETLIRGARIYGNLIMRRGRAFLFIHDTAIGGNVLIHDLQGRQPTNDGRLAVVAMFNNTMYGHVHIHGNDPAGLDISVVSIHDNVIYKNLHLHNNTANGGSIENTLEAYNNTVGGHLRVTNNRVSGPGGVIRPDDLIWVGNNTVEKVLACRGNTPDPVLNGSEPNAAERVRAECADLDEAPAAGDRPTLDESASAR